MIEDIAKEMYNCKMRIDSFNETDSSFCFLPATSLAESARIRANLTAHYHATLTNADSRLADLLKAAYGIDNTDWLAQIESEEEDEDDNTPDTDEETFDSEYSALVAQVAMSFSVGACVGRWDCRLDPQLHSTLVDSDPLDIPSRVSSAMLLESADTPAITTPDGYPLRIEWDGIMVDDPNHMSDIVRRVREALLVLWKDRAEAIEREACEILGVKDLRDYFRKPGKGGFWDDHIARYTKSQRKAPIYWLLQSSKKSYAVWLYCHRLDKDTLFKVLVNTVEPKVRNAERELTDLRTRRTTATGKDIKALDRQIEKQDALVSELRDFEDKLRRAAELNLTPDLNDGVVLTIAPLRELVPWKEAKAYWEELLAGEYEWSSSGKQLREKGLVK